MWHSPQAKMQELLGQWQVARRELDALRGYEPRLPLGEFAAREAELLDQIEGLDADIWMLGHELPAN